MVSVALELLLIPITLWIALGFSLWLTVPRSGSSIIFRLSAVFLAVWAVLATTATVWVVANGSFSALLRLAGSPVLLFEPANAWVWLAGGVGAFLVFFVAFVLSQVVGRGILRLFPSREVDWPSSCPRPETPVQLRVIHTDIASAFAFTLVQREPGLRFRRTDFVLVSDRLLDALEPRERDAVLAHEVAHLAGLDGRYLTFFRTLSRLMRWDPVFAYLADVLTRREEYRADLDAVHLTQRPRALARALYKATLFSTPRSASLPGLLGVGGRRGRLQAIDRIQRLVALAESGEFPEETGA